MGFHSFLVRPYSRIWGPTAILATALTVSNIPVANALIKKDGNNGGGPTFMVLLFLVLYFRVLQLVSWVLGFHSSQAWYIICLGFLSVLAIINIAFMVYLSVSTSLPLVLPGVYIIFHAVLCAVEIFLGDELRRYMRGLQVIQYMDYLVRADATSLDTDVPTRKTTSKWTWSRLFAPFRRCPTGPIALPADHDRLELASGPSFPGQQSSSPREIPSELAENVLHWSRLALDWHTNKALWITSDNKEQCSEIASTVFNLLSPSGSDNSGIGVALVDVGETRSSFWPLVQGFAVASPEYRTCLPDHLPMELVSMKFRMSQVRSLIFGPDEHDISPWLYYKKATDIVKKLFCKPLLKVYKELDPQKQDSGTDLESAQSPEPPRVIVVVHGIRNPEQADEVYELIDELEVELGKHYKYIGVVAISNPELLRHVSDDDKAIMKYVCTLNVLDNGSVIYSGNSPTPPEFYENLFLLLVDGIHRIGGSRAQKMWKQLREISQADPIDVDDDGSRSTLSTFAKLYTASEDRKKILEILSKIRVITRAQINRRLLKDNIKIAEALQRLFRFPFSAYTKDIPTLPQEHAYAVLNLTHYILDRGVPDNDMVTDYKKFMRHAHRLLNWLAGYLKLLPEEIAVSGVTLLSTHPVKHGGFSNIYHGIYKNSDGDQVEVALKVLKVFEDQSDDERLLLQAKFTKEALVWHYLKHKNIVPFLGVDSTTFPSPARAMVSPWMPLGSVLKYMKENSPSSMYAIELLHDTILGLKYLHSVNIVHGDLCGRNILVDQKTGRARLTDFGLAAFVESDTSIKSSTRSGSARWMAPELLSPPPGTRFKRTPESDIWAFGCVCCEIWSEGQVPFNHIDTDPGVVFAFSNPSDTAMPYQNRPYDKAGNPMPELLWELVQCCFKGEPSERPTAQILADTLSAMKKHAMSQEMVNAQLEAPLLIASGSGTSRPRSPSPSVVEEDSEGLFPRPLLLLSLSPSPSSSPLPTTGKGKQRVRFEDEYTTVRFGPIDIDDDPQEMFGPIFERLLEVVRRNALVEPDLVSAHDSEHLAIRFHSLVDANNFAMTWTVYRFEPYLEVSAILVDVD
ncbi:hypothetical protein DFH07DRAFT_897892 [Mycena maculata]|uniref:Protein kinase domain-containing protein n=1 Tax=Mycena maculata TaxID=230809 RepID=A0AAD7HKJ7_9AGAR|nr:hypothetical protein DFH07DRAFT_897892 [Mycena maculata]